MKPRSLYTYRTPGTVSGEVANSCCSASSGVEASLYSARHAGIPDECDNKCRTVIRSAPGAVQAGK